MMLKPVVKSLTINRLPKELVDVVKLLAIENDALIPEVAEVVLLAGIQACRGTMYAQIHDLRLRKKRERAEQRKVKEELAQLTLKLDQEVNANDSAVEQQ